MATMKAAQLVEYKKPYELRDVAIPKATGRDILVKVYAASFCHTDVRPWSLVCIDGRSKSLMGRHCMAGIPCPLQGVMKLLGSLIHWDLRWIPRALKSVIVSAP
jgi:hypothetical protein